MKSLFSRFRHNKDTPSQSRPPSSTSLTNGHGDSSPSTRSSSYSESIANQRSSTPIAALHSQSSSSSSDSTRPHSTSGSSEHDDQYIPDVVSSEVADMGDLDMTIRARTMSASEAHVKKVTFRSPAPTPTTSVLLDDIIAQPQLQSQSQVVSDDRVRSSSQASRMTSTSPFRKPLPHQHQSGINGFFRSASAQSRSTSRQSLPLLPNKPIMTRKLSVPGSASVPSSAGLTSPTPSDQSVGETSTRSYLPPPNSWSEMAEDDLIANLGPRERTRQEVLWEIVSSEERYVQELIKLNETFCRALLPPSATSPALQLFDPSDTLSRTLSPTLSSPPLSSRDESFDFLPIAAQYSSGHASPPSLSNPRMNAYNILTNGRPSEAPPSRKPSSTSLSNGAGAGARSHHSLPPPKRDGASGTGLSGLNRMSYHPGAGANRLHKHDSRATSGSSVSSNKAPEPPQLPLDLKKVLAVLAGGILEGHIKLAAALRKRYENQYPLVRSLADVFTAHSYILREYATYVLHLEKTLEQVDSALSTYTASLSKRSSRHLENSDLGKLGKTLLGLEELAAERGESGLVISLSKPFQRLLKYPLLFQNLLFNTDPSLKEYEATLSMVDEVEEIVRTIEDEKASSEERERTRDVWARIEGLDKDKLLMAPKPNRLLVSETQIAPPDHDPRAAKDATKQRKSLRRLSDILKGNGESADLWVIRFSDVSLLCERVGMTNLPVSSVKSKGAGPAGRSDSLPELSGRSKYATTGRRAASIRARNLYKFVKVHEWHLQQKTGSTEGLLAMEDISRARSRPSESSSSKDLPTIPANPASPPDTPQKTTTATATVLLKTDDGPSPGRPTLAKRNKGDTDADTATMVSDRLSVMSFAFKGSDQIRPVARRTRTSIPPPSNTAARAGISKGAAPAAGVGGGGQATRRGSGSHMMNGKEAHAKFAHRLRSDELNVLHADATIRPISRTRRSLPPAMALKAGPGAGASPAGTGSGRGSPALNPTDRNTSGSRPRPTSASMTCGTDSRTGAAVKGKNVDGPDGNTKATPTVPKSPSMSISSVRGVKGAAAMQRPGATGAITGLPPSTSSAGGKRVVMKSQPGRAVRPSGSDDSAGVGIWNTYKEGGAVGSSTPVRRPGAPSRQLGARI